MTPLTRFSVFCASVLTSPKARYRVFGAFNDTQSRNQTKLRKVTFELRLSYEKLRKLEKVTNELRKSYEKLQKVTKSYKLLTIELRNNFL